MPKLVPTEMPQTLRREPKYLPYVPTVREFVASGEACCLVRAVRGDEDASKFPTRLNSAINSMGGRDEVGCRVSCVGGETYLVRV